MPSVMCVGNGFIRSEASNHHPGSLNGTATAMFWNTGFSILGYLFVEPAAFEVPKTFGMHKCVPYEKIEHFPFNEPLRNA